MKRATRGASRSTEDLIVGPWSVRAAIVFSLLNVILFFGGDLISTIRRESSYWKTRANFRRAMRR